MPFSYITLEPNYILLSVENSPNGIAETSYIPALVFGSLFQKSAASTLVIGTHYCLAGENVKSVLIEEIEYYLAKEENLKFIETPPM